MIKRFEVIIKDEKDILNATDIFGILRIRGINVEKVSRIGPPIEKKLSLEEELLKKIEEAPDGSFIKAWGYSMYGVMKAIESTSKNRRMEGRM